MLPQETAVSGHRESDLFDLELAEARVLPDNIEVAMARAPGIAVHGDVEQIFRGADAVPSVRVKGAGNWSLTRSARQVNRLS